MSNTPKALLLLLTLAACERVSPIQPSLRHIAPESTAGASEADIWSLPDREHPVKAPLTQAPNVPPPIMRERPAFVVVDLEVVEVEREIAPGTSYMMWTFGGQVPGKFIRVRQGDTVELHLKNHPSSKLPHNIDLHAVTGPGGGASATLTAPGHESKFTFHALNPGIYVYHCATAPVPMHVANGMYGLILVEPPQGLPRVDREYYVMQGELYTSGAYHAPGLQGFDLQKGIDEKPTYVLFNGAEGSLTGDRALKAKTGEKVRIFFGNGGPGLASNFHVIGEIFDHVYTEGGSKTQDNVQTTLVPAGGATMVEFTVDVPGTYAIVDHALFRAFNKGAVGELRVEGFGNKSAFSGRQSDTLYTATAPGAEEPAIPVKLDPAAAAGEATFSRICATCHQANGQGVPNVFPPLASSDYLAKTNKDMIIGHIVNGVQGEITVNGATYNGVMPPLAHLPDYEIANVLTYVRASWGNKLDAVTPAEVARVRALRGTAP
jgi:nitrite reductase (NO-forming)